MRINLLTGRLRSRGRSSRRWQRVHAIDESGAGIGDAELLAACGRLGARRDEQGWSTAWPTLSTSDASISIASSRSAASTRRHAQVFGRDGGAMDAEAQRALLGVRQRQRLGLVHSWPRQVRFLVAGSSAHRPTESCGGRSRSPPGPAGSGHRRRSPSSRSNRACRRPRASRAAWRRGGRPRE